MLTFLIITALVTLLLYGYYYLYKPLHHWRQLGLEQDEPWSIFKSLLLTFYYVIFTSEDPLVAVRSRYGKFPGKRYYGIYEVTTPGIMIKDPDLVSQMLVRDFVHFNDHRVLIHDDLDPLFTRCIFALKGEDWQKVRKTLTPSYTSSKIRGYFDTMVEYSQNLATYYLNKNEEISKIEMRDVTTRFCNDVSAKLSFGIEVDSFKEPDNYFWTMCNRALNTISKQKVLTFNTFLIAPKLVKYLRMKIVDWEADTFFRQVLSDTVTVREKERENGIVGADLINMLLEGRKRAKMNKDTIEKRGEDYITYSADWTNMDIIAQAFFFHFAACAPAPTLLCFMGYELAANPEVQSKLRQEIEEAADMCKGNTSYEIINKMKYMDMVVQESMRKWPSVIEVDRICSKDYVIEPVLPGERPIPVKKGARIIAPIYSLHHDPKYFPDPESFIPERFSDSNKHNIKANTFSPFGFGSRTCMGGKFSILQAKILYFHILYNFELILEGNTKVPLKVAKIPRLNGEGGLWLGLKSLKKRM